MQIEPLLVNTDDAPVKDPFWQYLWTVDDVQRARINKAYEPEGGSNDKG